MVSHFVMEMYMKCTENTTRTTYIVRAWTRKSYRGNRERLRDLQVRENLWRSRNKMYMLIEKWLQQSHFLEEQSGNSRRNGHCSLGDKLQGYGCTHNCVFTSSMPRNQNYLWGQTGQKVSPYPGWAGSTGSILARKKPGQEDTFSWPTTLWTNSVINW